MAICYIPPSRFVEASKREDSGSKELQRKLTRVEVEECVAKLKNRKAAGADEIVNEFRRYGGGGYSFVACLSRLTTDHASLSRRRGGNDYHDGYDV